MNDFVFSYPTKVYFGQGASKKYLPALLENVGKNVLLAYGGGSIQANGIYDEMKQILSDANKNVVEFGGIMPNPTYEKVQEGAALVRSENIDFILAVGGGSVSDCCKIVAAQALYDEDIWEMEYGDGPKAVPNKAVPMGVVFTASGTGSEQNGGGVITHEEKKWKGGIFALAPVFAILDPAYTLSVPRMQVLSGAFDTLSHAMETYFGNSDEDNVSDEVALAIMRNTVVNMRRLLKDINDIQARGNLMWDSAMAENGILKVGRLTDFQAHQIEHQLGAYTDCNHGQGLAAIHPAYYAHILNDAPLKFTRFAKVVFDKETKEEGLQALKDFIEECGLPTKISQLKTRVHVTKELLREVADSSNLIGCNPRKLSHDEVFEILMESL